MPLPNSPEPTAADVPLKLATPVAAPAAEPVRRPRLGHRPELDGLRGIAVLMVVVYHVGAVLWTSAGWWMPPGGSLGVDLFFVLSGFLITSMLLGEHEHRGHVDLRAFARRRLLRLVPAMLGLFGVVLAVAATTTRYQVDEVLSTAGWSLTFTANWAIVDGRPNVLGHLWSVAVEGQFYLLWSVATVVALRFRHAFGLLTAGAAAAVVAVVSWRYARADGGANLFLLYLQTGARFDAPLVGALAGVAFATGRLDRLRGRSAAAVGVAGLAVVLAAAATMGPADLGLYRGVFTVVALAGACAIVGAVRADDGVLIRVLGSRPLARVGIVSYSLYLWHLPIFDWLADETPGWPPLARSAVAVAAAGGAAAVSYLFVERPFLRRRHRLQP